METILFNNNDITPGIRLTKNFKEFLASIFHREKVGFNRLSYIFCRDAYLLSLNQKFLHHHTLTDILTFNLSDTGESVEAEIYISIDRVRENAITLKTNYREELYRVMIHGILHLCGYSDQTSTQKKQIRKKEDYYLSKLRST